MHMDAADAAFADVFCGQKQISKEIDTSASESHTPGGKHSFRTGRNEDLFSQLELPELSLMSTLKMPLSAHHSMRTDKGPQGAITRLAKRLQNASAYEEIKEGNAAREDTNVAAAQDFAAPSAEKTLQSLEHPGSAISSKHPPSSHNHIEALHQVQQALSIPHAKLHRDDRPDYSAPYIDPFLSEPLEKHLWLPRDPLYAVDLDDTIGELGITIHCPFTDLIEQSIFVFQTGTAVH